MLRTLLVAVLVVLGGAVIAPSAHASGPYKNCSAAHADGRYNIPQGDKDYKSSQDRDGDGIACEG